MVKGIRMVRRWREWGGFNGGNGRREKGLVENYWYIWTKREWMDTITISKEWGMSTTCLIKVLFD